MILSNCPNDQRDTIMLKYMNDYRANLLKW